MELVREQIDTNWINEFENIDDKYKVFYREKVEEIRIFSLYSDKNFNLFHIKKEKHILSDSLLKTAQLKNLVKKNMIHNNKKFRPISLLSYNFNLDETNVKDYIHKSEQYSFLKNHKSFKDIKWQDTIVYFKELNSLFILYFETWKENKNCKTKKIFIKNSKNKKTKKHRSKSNNTKLH